MDKKTYECIEESSGEKILERRTCKWTGEEFPIFQGQKDIEDKMQSAYYQDLSPESIFRIICMFRNERVLYKNVSKKSGKPTISMYAPESGVKIYTTPELYAEDFSRPANDIPTTLNEIEKVYAQLLKETPKTDKLNDKNENAEYANYVGSSKNIYMSFLTYYESEDILYSYYAMSCKDIVDCFYTNKSDLCYECSNTFGSYGCFWCYKMNNSRNCYFSVDLDNCDHCLFCHNLRDKKYYIHNKEYSKEEYETYLKDIKNKIASYSSLKNCLSQYQEVLNKAIYKGINQVNCDHSVGDGIINCHKSLLTFESIDCDECYNVWGGPFEKCVNIIGGHASYIINSGRVGAGSSSEHGSNIMGSYNVYTSHNIVACQDLVGCSHMLFCCGLRNKEYCILNQQYSKEEREAKSLPIIQEMKKNGTYGAPPDYALSPFPYNDTVANDLFPIQYVIKSGIKTEINPEGKGTVTILDADKFISEAVLDLGGAEKINIHWRNKEIDITIPPGIETIPANELPENITDVQDDILAKAIICEISGRPFKIVAPELAFYRKQGLALPRRHPDIRHKERSKNRPKRIVYVRTCDHCGQEMISIYPQTSSLRVYCEQCYNKEIYG